MNLSTDRRVLSKICSQKEYKDIWAQRMTKHDPELKQTSKILAGNSYFV